MKLFTAILLALVAIQLKSALSSSAVVSFDTNSFSSFNLNLDVCGASEKEATSVDHIALTAVNDQEARSEATEPAGNTIPPAVSDSFSSGFRWF